MNECLTTQSYLDGGMNRRHPLLWSQGFSLQDFGSFNKPNKSCRLYEHLSLLGTFPKGLIKSLLTTTTETKYKWPQLHECPIKAGRSVSGSTGVGLNRKPYLERRQGRASFKRQVKTGCPSSLEHLYSRSCTRHEKH